MNGSAARKLRRKYGVKHVRLARFVVDHPHSPRLKARRLRIADNPRPKRAV